MDVLIQKGHTLLEVKGVVRSSDYAVSNIMDDILAAFERLNEPGSIRRKFRKEMEKEEA